jgi:hypothetical protein
VPVAVKIGSLPPRLRLRARTVFGAFAGRHARAGFIAAGLACAMVCGFAGATLNAACKPNHFRPTFFVKIMGACAFDPQTLRYSGDPVAQARCLMRGMDATRNLAPALESLPPALASRVGQDSGLPSREALSAFLSKENLEWDFAGSLWQPASRAHDNDPDDPLARYFVIHDTSGPNYGHRFFPADIDVSTKINNLGSFKCSDGWGKAHVVVNRSGGMLLNHDFAIPWRETRFEQAANFAGALKGLFLHVELIQPRRSEAGRGRRNDAQSPDPGFTAAQYDRLALLYVVASVRADYWLVPAFHAAIDAGIRNGHDDPLHFDVASFADSVQRLVDELADGAESATVAPIAARPTPWGEVDATQPVNYSVTTPLNPATMPNLPVLDANAETTPDPDRSHENTQTAEVDPKIKIESEGRSERKTVNVRHCQTRIAQGYRRRVCWTDVVGARARGTRLVRSMDRRVSYQSAGARHHAGNLRAGHGRAKAGHRRA